MLARFPFSSNHAIQQHWRSLCSAELGTTAGMAFSPLPGVRAESVQVGTVGSADAWLLVADAVPEANKPRLFLLLSSSTLKAHEVYRIADHNSFVNEARNDGSAEQLGMGWVPLWLRMRAI